jgi:hypothetical protein
MDVIGRTIESGSGSGNAKRSGASPPVVVGRRHTVSLPLPLLLVVMSLLFLSCTAGSSSSSSVNLGDEEELTPRLAATSTSGVSALSPSSSAVAPPSHSNATSSRFTQRGEICPGKQTCINLISGSFLACCVNSTHCCGSTCCPHYQTCCLSLNGRVPPRFPVLRVLWSSEFHRHLSAIHACMLMWTQLLFG